MASKSVLDAQDQKKVVEGLIAQGIGVELRRLSRYAIKFPNGDMQVFNLGTGDSNGITRSRTIVKGHGYHWPLDPQPKVKVAPVRPVAKSVTTPPGPRPEPVLVHDPVIPEDEPAPQYPDAMRVERITPEIAEQYLETMRVNRRVSEGNVKRFAQMMRDGLWIYDGSPIRFNTRGELVDGQHRLWALIEADHSADFLVMRNIPDEAMATMDTGKSRSLADVISLRFPGTKRLTAVAAIVQAYYRWTIGRRGNQLRLGGNFVVPNAVLLEFYAQHKDRIDAAAYRAQQIYLPLRGIPTTSWGLAILVLEEIDKTDAEYFFNAIRNRVTRGANDPIARLVDLSSRLGREKGVSNAEQGYWMGVIFKAWNAFREGREIQILSFKRGGASPEAFPEPR